MVVDARQLRVLKTDTQSDLRAIRRLDEAVAEAVPRTWKKNLPRPCEADWLYTFTTLRISSRTTPRLVGSSERTLKPFWPSWTR